MPLFDKGKCTVLERKKIKEGDDLSSFQETPEHILPIYDTISWKLNSEEKENAFFLMESQENFLKSLKTHHEKHAFGICVSSPKHAEIASKYADCLYVPAELCRQSDVLSAAAQTKLPLFVEKGCFLAPNDMVRLVEKIKETDFSLVECGTSNGYSDCVLDPRSLFLMKSISPHFGVSLSDLLAPEGISYEFRPSWLKNQDFLLAFIKTAQAFQASFFVIKNSGNGKLDHQHISKEIGNRNG